jgi:hypothetical protein
MNTDPATAPKIEIARKLYAEMKDAQLVCRAADALRIDSYYYRIANAKLARTTNKFVRYMQQNGLPLAMFT